MVKNNISDNLDLTSFGINLINIKRFILFITVLFSITISAQTDSDYSEALQLYNANHFIEARERFLNITFRYDIDENLVVASKYYAADCLRAMELYNGAITEFEYFIRKYGFSNFKVEALFKLGKLYYLTGNYTKVREKLLILINEYPKDKKKGEAYYWIGQSYIKENKYRDAEEYLLEAISLNRYKSEVDYTMYSLAFLYEQQGKYDEAVAYYDELLAYHLDSKLLPDAQLRIGACYFKLKEYDRAVLELTDHLIKQLPDIKQIEAGYLLANSYFRLGEYNKAEETYRTVLKKKSSGNIERELKFGIAWVNFQQGNYDEAYKQFRALYDENIKDSLSEKTLYWCGESKRYLGETGRAEKIYSEFLSKYNTSQYTDAVKLSLGIIQYSRGELKKASENLNVAAYSKNKSYSSRALILLGEINLEYKNFTAAEGYFAKTLNIPYISNDATNRAILGIGVSQYYQGKYEDAIMNLTDIAVRVKSFEPRKTNFYLAEAYFKIGNYRKAQQHYYRVDKGNDYIGQAALYGMAYSYFNLKDYGNAAYYFKEYLTKYGKRGYEADVQLRLADSYFGMKNFELAEAEYRKYFGKYSKGYNNDFALFQYGQALFKSGKSDMAIKKFELLLRKFPNSKYTDDSRYLIGWIYFQQNEFNRAILNYKKLVKDYPKSSIVPIAFYSIGDSYYNL